MIVLVKLTAIILTVMAPSSIFAADKESKQAAEQNTVLNSDTCSGEPGQVKTVLTDPAGNKTVLIKTTINESDSNAKQQKEENNNSDSNSKQEENYNKQLEIALKSLKKVLPTTKIPKIDSPKEQVTKIGFLGGLLDSANYHTYDNEAYLRKHVQGDTLRVALPTSDAQRAKFGHAANELARKAQERRDKNIIKRMGELVAWSNAYKVGLNEEDLNLMRSRTLECLTYCVATLATIDDKSAHIKEKILALHSSTEQPKQVTQPVQPQQQ